MREAGQEEGRTRPQACVRQQIKRDNKDTEVFQGPLGEDCDVEKWPGLAIMGKVNYIGLSWVENFAILDALRCWRNSLLSIR